MVDTLDLLQQWLMKSNRQNMQSLILFLKEKKLSMSQMGAIFFVHKQHRCGISNLGENLGISSGAVSQLLDQLVDSELITREKDPNDRRMRNLKLTEKGSQLLKESMQIRQEWLKKIDKILNPEEREKIETAFQILIQKADKLATKRNKSPN